MSVGACAIGDKGKFNYDSTGNIWRYCNGTNWISFAVTVSTSTCSTAGALAFDGSYVARFCNGTNWVYANSVNFGYFILGSSAYRMTGSMGGLAGANANCLADLTANNWNGKDDAQRRGLLVAAKVKAWLCDGATCNEGLASTRYRYGAANDLTAGGTIFTTDASGLGPNSGNSWKVAGTFSTTTGFWTGRSAGTANQWGATPAADTCSGLTSNTAGGTPAGVVGTANANNGTRWNTGTPADCSGVRFMICFVHP